jgi:hypothetical protein
VRPENAPHALLRAGKEEFNMNEINLNSPAGNQENGTSVLYGSLNNANLSRLLPMMGAVCASAASLSIAAYAGWHRGGTLVERAIVIAMFGLAVLYMHMLPLRWSTLHVPVRMVAFAVWCIALVAVMYGQLVFFVTSEQHAGNQRAAWVAVTAVPQSADVPPSRSLTEIAQDISKVTADLVRSEARRCIGDCPTLTARKAILTEQVAALNTEAHEATRHEAAEDRRNERIDRNEALRATLRADPVATLVALWLGTTEARLELMQAIAYAVVLEGAAIIGWLLLSVSPGRTVGHASVVFGDHQPVASVRGVASDVTEPVAMRQPVADAAVVVPVDGRVDEQNGLGSLTPEDEELLTTIREEVVEGRLKPTQKAIREFLGRGQPEAGRVRRLYVARFGTARG